MGSGPTWAAKAWPKPTHAGAKRWSMVLRGAASHGYGVYIAGVSRRCEARGDQRYGGAETRRHMEEAGGEACNGNGRGFGDFGGSGASAAWFVAPTDAHHTHVDLEKYRLAFSKSAIMW